MKCQVTPKTTIEFSIYANVLKAERPSFASFATFHNRRANKQTSDPKNPLNKFGEKSATFTKDGVCIAAASKGVCGPVNGQKSFSSLQEAFKSVQHKLN